MNVSPDTPERSPRPGLWHRLDRMLARMRPHREPLSLLIDAVVIALAWNLTYLFRLGFDRWLSARPDYDPLVLLGVVTTHLCALWLFKVPQAMWRFSGFGDLRRVVAACALAGLAAGVAVRLLGLMEVPRAVLALHPWVSLMGLSLVRLSYRALYEHARERIAGADGHIRRAIVMGAGDAARRLLAAIHHQGWVVLGVLDDDPATQGARIAGVPVLGPLAAVGEARTLGGATHVIVAMPEASAGRRRQVLALAATSGLPVLTLPTASHGPKGADQARLREVEPEDLLGRDPVQLDEAGIAELLAGQTVLITGAGGSIGSELCRQVAHYRPARLVLYELSEFNLYRVDQDLQAEYPDLTLTRLMGDVKDLEHLQAAMVKWHPAVVFHAAAFKHVPLMEEDDNALAALRNNTLGTYHAALAAAQTGVQRFVLISTDKAVNPTSIMGATKRAAEMVISAMAGEHPATRFMAVRFGNVLGSSGSVIPKFKEQIAKGGPVTVTHPEVVRYFMTIPEASRLVLQAAAIGETGQVLVLDMGEPVRIVDLANDLIRLAGLSPEEVGIEFSGLRPGEKLFEELMASRETLMTSPVPQLQLAFLREADPDWLAEVGRLAAHRGTQTGGRAALAWLRLHLDEYPANRLGAGEHGAVLTRSEA